VLVKKEGSPLLVVKGAFKQILEICAYAEMSPGGSAVPVKDVEKELNERFIEFSAKGFRVLGLAYRNGEGIGALKCEHEAGMTFLGFLLFLDEPKADIAETVANLKKMGITLKIITGDNRFMAMHLANLLNISKEEVMTGADLQNMSDRALLHQVNHRSIFAEVEPNQKERIILALRKTRNVVGFLGDGINDVTALHAADVSISVDTGADAAKEAADIVLLNKDLSVLQDGVLSGRMTFANTLKYVFMATSANFGNMFSMAGASVFLNFLPMLPKQILLTNLMEDFPEMAIATDHVDQEMLRKPLRWNIGFIRKFMMVFGLISSIFDYATFGLLLLLRASVEEFRTGWFIESVASAAFIVLMIRTFRPFYTSSPSKPLLGMVLGVIGVTFLLPWTPIAHYLGFTPLPWYFYLFILLVLGLYMLFVELAKHIFLKRWMR
jgi:Mg2+-importing ATPase